MIFINKTDFLYIREMTKFLNFKLSLLLLLSLKVGVNYAQNDSVPKNIIYLGYTGGLPINRFKDVVLFRQKITPTNPKVNAAVSPEIGYGRFLSKKLLLSGSMGYYFGKGSGVDTIINGEQKIVNNLYRGWRTKIDVVYYRHNKPISFLGGIGLYKLGDCTSLDKKITDSKAQFSYELGVLYNPNWIIRIPFAVYLKQTGRYKYVSIEMTFPIYGF